MRELMQNTTNILTPYQEFIHMTRYSRWLSEQSRRETWSETVQRYIDFFVEERGSSDAVINVLKNEIQPAILNMRVMPSMRAMMTAGPALKRENIAGFNCSYLAINNKRAFSEAMYISLCGTGVGFSAERQEVSKLPVVPMTFEPSSDVIMVADSKEGWAKAYSRLISSLYLGDVPLIDYSKVRPEGAKLKVFGGRASGPAPLKRLFDFTISVFKKAHGRKLTPTEVHDIMCMIGEIVVVGGVRRSALISLSDLDDSMMAMAKSNFAVDQYSLINETDSEWVYTVTMKRNQPVNPTYRISLKKETQEWLHNMLEVENKLPWFILEPQRALANNSVAYTKKPNAEVFMGEWLSLVKSKSGERGIFNRQAAQNQATRWGRRSPLESYGTNPCCFTGDTLIAVADGRNACSIQQLAEESDGVNQFLVYSAAPTYYANQNGASSTFKSWRTEIKQAIAKCTGEKPVVLVTLSNGDTFKVTDDHLFATNTGEYKMVKDLVGVKLVKFFTNKEKYRTINSVTNGYSRQYRMIWEFFNGTKPENFEIDHIENNGYDGIGNLQLLEKRDHLAKTAGEMTGKNNPAANMTTEWANNISISASTDNNSRWSGLSDYDLIEIARAHIANGGMLNLKSLKESHSDFPSSFSKNRFGGSFDNFKKIVLGEMQYVAPSLLERVENSDLTDNSYLTDDVYIVSIEDAGTQKIYDLQVEDNHNFYIITKSFDQMHENTRGVLVHNSEIILRDKQFCNLSEVIIRATDSREDIKAKVRIASIIGTFQSTLTDFGFLSEAWRKNTEAEALLGVSMTGIMDNSFTAGLEDREELAQFLSEMRDYAREVNAEWAKILNVKPSAAITAVKPSGTVSQLCDTASGIHARHSDHYIRTVRLDKKDPVYEMFKASGMPMEDDLMKPASVAVVSYPQSAPEGAVTRNQFTAIQQLETWLIYQRHWCEHKPSVTISVGDDEWMEVGAWVYKHFDEISGVSFLPRSEHTYEQAPYQDKTAEQLGQWMKSNPTPHIDWSELSKYELDDQTVSMQTLACVSGDCEV